jgi:hypothetical protein
MGIGWDMDLGDKINVIDQEMVRNMKSKFSKGFKGVKDLQHV